MGVILGGLGCGYGGPAAALTGRLDPTPDVAAAGAWMEALLGVEIQEALSDRRRACRSNVVRAGGLGRANKASHDDPVRVERRGSGGSRSADREHKSPSAGAGRQPPDREVLEDGNVLEEAP